jgi:feruloyl esterase
VPDSRIGIEVWIPPAASWNGKLLGTGNGGFSSAMSYPAIADGLNRGYAVVATDTGHSGDTMDFGVGHPEKIIDWAYRAVHIMTDVAKLVVRNHQGRFPTRAYFSGCSTGGQQALSEAQRYPHDYDGIIAGNPASNRLHLIYAFLWTWLAAHGEHDRQILPSSKLPALATAVMTSCDAHDGLKDGLIADPRACRFDPAQLTCSGAESDACLTTEQVQAVKKIYDGTRHARTDTKLFPGWAYGSELGWRGYITDAKEPVRNGLFTGWAFHNPRWNPWSFDFDRDVAYIDETLAFVSAISTDLGAFRKRRGKLIMYTGLVDAVVPPQDTVDYYERVVEASGGLTATRGYFRFFPVPGMGHCGGGSGPNRFDMLSALDAWVEKGAAPDRIVATQVGHAGRVVRTRPLCAYPAQARYKGTGSVDAEAQFTCQVRTPQGQGPASR